MFKNTSLIVSLFLFCSAAQAENWRYCAANAPLNTPCKDWVSAYLAGHAPETDPQEIPSYMSDNAAFSLQLNPVNRSDIPSFGTPIQTAAQPFLKVSTTVIVR
jgi:hypothetical protein